MNQTYRVLVVDDEVTQDFIEDVQHELAWQMGEDVIQVDIVTNTDEALLYIQQTQCHVLVVDEVLKSAKTGISLLRDLKTLGITKFPERIRPATIMLTGQAPEKVGIAKELGVYGFLVKGLPNQIASGSTQLANHIIGAIEASKEASIIENIRDRLPELMTADDIYETACKIAVETFGVDSSGVVEFPPRDEDGKVEFGFVAMRYPRHSETQSPQPRLQIAVKGILAEEELVYRQKTVNFSDLEGALAQYALGDVADYLVERDNTRSILIMPIVVENNVVASISIDSRTVMEFKDAHEDALRLLAHQLGPVWYYRRIMKRLDALNDEWRNLYKKQFSSVDELIPHLVQIAENVMKTSHAGLCHYNLLKDEYEATEGNLIEQTICSDPRIGSGQNKPVYLPFVKGETTLSGSALATPLMIGNRNLGLLYIYQAESYLFLEPEKRIFEKIAQQAADAIQQREERDRQRQLNKTLQQIARVVQGDSVTSEQILHAILTGVTSEWGFRFNRAIILLLDDYANTPLLVGREGVGFLDPEEARKNWENKADLVHGFSDYWKAYTHNPYDKRFNTPLSEEAKQIRIPLNEDAHINQIFMGDTHEIPRPLLPEEVKQLHPSLKKHLAIGDDYQSQLALIPILDENNEKIVGILVADNFVHNTPTSQRAILSSQTLATFCTVVYRNNRRRFLANLIERFGLSNDNGEIWRSVAEEACQFLNCDIASIYIYNPIEKTLEDPPIIFSRKGEPIQLKEFNYRRPIRDSEKIPNRVFHKCQEQGGSWFVADAEKDPILQGSAKPFVQKHEILSVGAMILRINDEPIGLMFVNYQRNELFTQSLRDDFKHFANQVAFLLRATVQYQDISQEAKNLRDLFNTSKALVNINNSQAGDNNHLLEQVVANAQEMSNADIVSIYIIDENLKIIDEKHTDGEIPIVDPLTPKTILEDGHIAYVLKHGKPVECDFIPQDLRSNDGKFIDGEVSVNAEILDQGYNALICLPLYLPRTKTDTATVIGVMWVGYKKKDRDDRRFTYSSKNDLQIYADFATASYLSQLTINNRFTALNTLIGLMDNAKLDESANIDIAIDDIIKKSLHASLSLVEQHNPLQAKLYFSLFGTVVADRVIFFNESNDADNIEELRKHDLELDENNNPYIDLANPANNPDGKRGIIGVAATQGGIVTSDTHRHELIPLKSDNPSQIAVCVMLGERVYGVLSIEHPNEAALNKNDEDALRAFASYLGSVIRAIVDKRQFRMMLNVANTLLNNQANQTEDDILKQIAHQAHQIISISPDLEKSFCHVVRRNPKDPNRLEMVGYMPHHDVIYRRLNESYQTHIDLGNPDSEKGIVGRVMLNKSKETPHIYEPDLKNNPSADYIAISKMVRSQLTVGILVEGANEPYGAINIEHPSINAFDTHTINTIITLAHIAGLALSNLFSKQNNQALAWAGISNGILQNRANAYLAELTREAEVIMESVELLREQLNSRADQATIKNSKRIALNKHIKTYVDDNWAIQTDNLTIQCETDPQLDTVRMPINIEFLQRVLDILIDNALGTPATEIKVMTHQIEESNIFEITVQDNGNGIPLHIQSTLFLRVHQKDNHQEGLGTITARSIVDSLGGTIFIKETNETGTIIAIHLPLPEKTSAHRKGSTS